MQRLAQHCRCAGWPPRALSQTCAALQLSPLARLARARVGAGPANACLPAQAAHQRIRVLEKLLVKKENKLRRVKLQANALLTMMGHAEELLSDDEMTDVEE